MKDIAAFLSALVFSCLLYGCSVSASNGIVWSESVKSEKNKKIALELAWQYALNAPVVATPVVSGNQLIVAAENGNLYSFDLASQKLVWIYRTEGAIASTPAIANGVIYSLSRDGFLHALDQSSGKLLWRFATGGESRFAAVGSYGMKPEVGPVPDPWDFHLSSPVIWENKVFFGSSDKNLYVLDSASGELLWSFTADEMIHSTPIIQNGKIFFSTWGSKVYALDVNSGKPLWQFQAGVDKANFVMHGITASPVVDARHIYVGARDGYFYALDQANGKLRWRYDAASTWVLADATLDANTVYVATSDIGLLLALDKNSGVEKYRANTRFWSYTKPLLVNDHFIVASNMQGELYGFDKSTGQSLWHYQTQESRADANDILDNKTGKIRAEKIFSPAVQLQASVEWVKMLGAFIASPIWVDNQLIAVTTTGNILVFASN